MHKNHEADAQLTQERLAFTKIEQKLKAYLNVSDTPAKAYATLALRSVQLASMWLGRAKGALGITSPYPQSFNAASNVIEERADFEKIEAPVFSAETVISDVKALRAELKSLEKAVWNDNSIMTENREYQHAVLAAYTDGSKATMWLGMVLGEIKDQQDAKAPVTEVTSPSGQVLPEAHGGELVTTSNTKVTASPGATVVVEPAVTAKTKTTSGTTSKTSSRKKGEAKA